MISRVTVSIPVVNQEAKRPFFGRNSKIEIDQIKKDISGIIEGIGIGSLDDNQHYLLRSYIYSHYHSELRIRSRVQVYQAVKEALEDENLNQLKNIAGIKQKSAYINTITNVGKRSSYFGGLIGVSVVGYFFLPPIIKIGILPVARSAVRKFVPKQIYLIPIDKNFKLSSLIKKSPAKIYAGIQTALGSAVRQAGKPVSARIDTTPMDDLVGNLFFRSLIEESTYSDSAKEDFRIRAQIAFLYDMARVSRQLEGLARNPNLSWERITHYTNFAMFLKSMESKEVPIQEMLPEAVEIISRARIKSGRKNHRFYTEFERGLKNLNYVLQVVEPLDRFNEDDAFDDLESRAAKLAFFEQNRLVMERLYIEHDRELAMLRPMFDEFEEAARNEGTNPSKTREANYEDFKSKIGKIVSSYRSGFKDLGTAELQSYDMELFRLRM